MMRMRSFMSCWVVPSLAAELWHIPLSDLLQRIRDGMLPVLREEGWTFVDVAPEGHQVSRPSLPPEQRPPPYTLVAESTPPALSIGEVLALSDDTPPAAPPTSSEELSEDEEMLVEDESVDDVGTIDLGDWRAARAKNSRLRRPPPRQLHH
jgi:hypothetical protein